MHTEAECCSQMLPSWALQWQYVAYIYIYMYSDSMRSARNAEMEALRGQKTIFQAHLYSQAESGFLCKHALPLWTCKFSWQYIPFFQNMEQWASSLLEDTRGAQCLNTIAVSSSSLSYQELITLFMNRAPPPSHQARKWANYIKSADEPGGTRSVALSIRL